MLRVFLVCVACSSMIGSLFADTPAWEPVGLSGGGAMFNPAVSPADPKLAIVHCDMSAAYLTHDGGASWQMIDTARLRSNTRCRAAFHPTDSKTIISPHGATELRISRDGGIRWETLATFKDELTGPLTIDAHDAARLVVGVGRAVQFSADGGRRWQVCQGPRGAFVGACFGRAAPDGEQFLAVATDQGVWVRRGEAAAFQDATAGLPSKAVRSLAGGSDNSRAMLYCTLPGENRAGRYLGGVYRSRDLGRSWQPATGAGLNLDIKKFDQWGQDSVAQYHGLAASDDRPLTVWVASGNTGVPPPHHATVYRSDDAGETWHATFFPDPRYPGFNVEKDYTVVEEGQFYQDRPQIALAAHDPGHVLQINGGSCYFTTDGGATCACGHTRAAGSPQRGAAWRNTGLVVTTTWRYYVDPQQPARHYICYTDLGFARSLDAGATWIWWSQQGRAPWQNTCYELAFDTDRPGRIFGAFSSVHDIPNANIIFNRHDSKGPGGICASDDFAATWKPLGGGLPVAPATAIVLDPKSPRIADVVRRVLRARRLQVDRRRPRLDGEERRAGRPRQPPRLPRAAPPRPGRCSPWSRRRSRAAAFSRPAWGCIAPPTAATAGSASAVRPPPSGPRTSRSIRRTAAPSI